MHLYDNRHYKNNKNRHIYIDRHTIYIYIKLIHPHIYIGTHTICILPFLKRGDLGIAKNNWGITLISIAAKIYNALLCNCIEPEIEKILRKNQNGFRRNWSMTSQILTICRILEGIHAKNLDATPYTEGGWSKYYLPTVYPKKLLQP